MDALGDVLVSDLMEMSVEELRSRGMINLKDPENLTAGHMERLKLLVNGLDERQGLDLGAVNEKLENLCEPGIPVPRPRTPSLLSDTTPDANDPVIREQDRLSDLYWEHKAYQGLIQEGGQPSHRPDDSGFDYLYEPQTGIIWYWITVCGSRESIFTYQRAWWTEFRKHQDWRRWRYWKPAWFGKFVGDVREYRRRKGLVGDICLLQDRHAQSKLQDWVECQYWEHQRADRFTRVRDRYAKEVEREESRLQAAIDAGRPAEEITRIRKNGLAIAKAEEGGAEIDLHRQNVFLKWIDEQLPLIASECPTLTTELGDSNGYPLESTGTSLGKRKRSTDLTSHRKDSRRKVRFELDKPINRELPVENTDTLHSGIADISVIEATRRPESKHQRHQHTDLSGFVDNILNLGTSTPVYQDSSSKRVKHSSCGRTTVNSVPAQNEKRQTRSKTSSLHQQRAIMPAKGATTTQDPKIELATSASGLLSTRSSSTTPATQSKTLHSVQFSRFSKARRRTPLGSSPEIAQREKTTRLQREHRQEGKPENARGDRGAVMGGREKQHVANAPVRRSARLSAKPAVYYLK